MNQTNELRGVITSTINTFHSLLEISNSEGESRDKQILIHGITQGMLFNEMLKSGKEK